jgi:hypothetical protein
MAPQGSSITHRAEERKGRKDCVERAPRPLPLTLPLTSTAPHQTGMPHLSRLLRKGGNHERPQRWP